MGNDKPICDSALGDIDVNSKDKRWEIYGGAE
jgi:hypothetical protein